MLHVARLFRLATIHLHGGTAELVSVLGDVVTFHGVPSSVLVGMVFILHKRTLTVNSTDKPCLMTTHPQHDPGDSARTQRPRWALYPKGVALFFEDQKLGFESLGRADEVGITHPKALT